jgi:hypothetical protein
VGFIAGFGYGAWQIGLLGLSGLFIAFGGWMAFRVRTTCGVANRRGGLCRRPTRGILFGCRKDHYWEKVFAWSRYVGVARLATKLKIDLPVFGHGALDDYQQRCARPQDVQEHSRRDIAMFYMAIIQTLTAIIGTVIAILALK